MHSRVAFLDIDETLTAKGVSSWEEVTKAVDGSISELYSSLVRLQSGEITLEESIAEVLGNWANNGNAKLETIKSALNSVALAEDAEYFIADLQNNGFEPVLITGSMNIFAESIARRLGVAVYFYNSELMFDSEGNLTDMTYEPDQSSLKLKQAQQYLTENDINPNECIAVGDSDNDIALFGLVGMSFALNSDSSELNDMASHKVSNLSEITQKL